MELELVLSPLSKPNVCQNIHNVKVTPNVTLNVRGPRYLGLTRSISWLLMPWLLTSPGHQQPWYWLCRIGRFLSYLRKDFSYLLVSMWRYDTKCKYMFMLSLKNWVRKGLIFCLTPNIRFLRTLFVCCVWCLSWLLGLHKFNKLE